jgi:hypothetical protein
MLNLKAKLLNLIDRKENFMVNYVYPFFVGLLLIFSMQNTHEYANWIKFSVHSDTYLLSE